MSNLSKADITELKAFSNPPAVVKDVMTVTMLLLGYTEQESKDWRKIKKVFGNAAFFEQVRACDTSKIPPNSIQKAKALLGNMHPDNVAKVSKAACSLVHWQCDCKILEKLDKYADLAFEMSRLHSKYTVVRLLIVLGALGLVHPDLFAQVRSVPGFSIGSTAILAIWGIHKAAVLGSLHILRKVLDEFD